MVSKSILNKHVAVGQTYQSIAYPHITRKVVRVNKGLVVYSIIDATKPESFCKMATGAEKDFLRTSREVTNAQGK